MASSISCLMDLQQKQRASLKRRIQVLLHEIQRWQQNETISNSQSFPNSYAGSGSEPQTLDDFLKSRPSIVDDVNQSEEDGAAFSIFEDDDKVFLDTADGIIQEELSTEPSNLMRDEGDRKQMEELFWGTDFPA